MSGAYDFSSQIQFGFLGSRSDSAKHLFNSAYLDSSRLKLYLRSSSESEVYGVDLSAADDDFVTIPFAITLYPKRNALGLGEKSCCPGVKGHLELDTQMLLKLTGEFAVAAFSTSSTNSSVFVATFRELIVLRRKRWQILRDTQLYGADGQLSRKWEQPRQLE